MKDRQAIERHTADGQWDYVCALHDSLFGGRNALPFAATIRREYLFEFAREQKVDLMTAPDEMLLELVNAAKIDALMRGATQRKPFEHLDRKGYSGEKAKVFTHRGVDVFWRAGSPSLVAETKGIIFASEHRHEIEETIDARLAWEDTPKRRVIWMRSCSRHIEYRFEWRVFEVAQIKGGYYRVSEQDGAMPIKMAYPELSSCYEYHPKLLLYLEAMRRRVDDFICLRENLAHALYALEGRLETLPDISFNKTERQSLQVTPTPCAHCGSPEGKDGRACPGYEPDLAWVKAFADYPAPLSGKAT